jgi:ATP-dependent Lon protease
MGKSSSKTSARVLPLIPLAVPYALLPATTLKIPIANRSDIAAILAKIYSVSPTAKPDAAITVACVPLNSPAVSPRDGKLLIEDGSKSSARASLYETDPVNATKKDVFGYACVARISGVQGRRQGELSLVVEGLERVRVVDVVQDRPYFEGELEAVEEFGMHIPLSHSLRDESRTNARSACGQPRARSAVQPAQAAVA